MNRYDEQTVEGRAAHAAIRGGGPIASLPIRHKRGQFLRIARSAAFLAAAMGSFVAQGATTTGAITTLHLNGYYSNAARGVCIHMTPALPESGWACLYRSNALYKEISSLLVLANVTAKVCSVSFYVKDSDNLWIIETVEC
jgi:hypothetical protein